MKMDEDEEQLLQVCSTCLGNALKDTIHSYNTKVYIYSLISCEKSYLPCILFVSCHFLPA